jgi:hypothetical protein
VLVFRISKDPVISVYCSAAVCLLICHYVNLLLYSVRLTCSTNCSRVERTHNLAAAVSDKATEFSVSEDRMIYKGFSILTVECCSLV